MNSDHRRYVSAKFVLKNKFLDVIRHLVINLYIKLNLILIGEEIFYLCKDEDQVVNDTSLSLVSTCLSTGLFSEIGKAKVFL